MPALPPFEDVYRTHAERIYYFCLSLVHNPAVAEDIAADTFVAAYTAYPTRRPRPDAVAPWLFVIARNKVVDHLRKSRRWDRLFQSMRRSGQYGDDVEHVAGINDELAKLLSAMAQLKERDRKLIALRAVGELSYRDIGLVLGLSEAGAEAATRRALERLRRASGEEL